MHTHTRTTNGRKQTRAHIYVALYKPAHPSLGRRQTRPRPVHTHRMTLITLTRADLGELVQIGAVLGVVVIERHLVAGIDICVKRDIYLWNIV